MNQGETKNTFLNHLHPASLPAVAVEKEQQQLWGSTSLVKKIPYTQDRENWEGVLCNVVFFLVA